MKDYYYILGVDAGCTMADLDEAYHKLSDKFKPDNHNADPFLTRRFNEIKEAYEVLSSPVRRTWYDEELHTAKPLPAGERQRVKKYHSTTKGINWALTIVLLTLLVVLGYYVYQAIYSHPKLVVASVQAAVVAPAVHKVKWHKHRAKRKKTYWGIANKSLPAIKTHAIETANEKQISTANVLPKAKVTAIVPAQKISVATPVQTAAAPVAQQNVKVTPVVAEKEKIQNNQESYKEEYLYATYLKANQTGVIRLREDASYNSEVIASVPGNTRVFVLERGPMYYKVKADNTIGYVPKWTVQEK